MFKKGTTFGLFLFVTFQFIQLYNPKIVFAQIPLELVQKLVQDEDAQDLLRDKYGNSLQALASSLLVQRIELNRDGKYEYLIEARNPFWCGSGGCNLWIYRETKSGYQGIFQDTIDQEQPKPQTRGTYTNGYLDLGFVTKRHSITGGFVDRVQWIKFNGKVYE
jgi:hypothetical protein